MVFVDGMTPSDLTDQEELLSIMPIYCGRALAFLSLNLRLFGMALMEHHLAIPCAAHLYLVAKNRTDAAPGNRTLENWTDMDELARLCGIENVYGTALSHEYDTNGKPVIKPGTAPTLENIRLSLLGIGRFSDRRGNKHAAGHSPSIAVDKREWNARRTFIQDGRRVLAFYLGDVLSPADERNVNTTI